MGWKLKRRKNQLGHSAGDPSLLKSRARYQSTRFSGRGFRCHCQVVGVLSDVRVSWKRSVVFQRQIPVLGFQQNWHVQRLQLWKWLYSTTFNVDVPRRIRRKWIVDNQQLRFRRDQECHDVKALCRFDCEWISILSWYRRWSIRRQSQKGSKTHMVSSSIFQTDSAISDQDQSNRAPWGHL